jgi:hypothetical protein
MGMENFFSMNRGTVEKETPALEIPFGKTSALPAYATLYTPSEQNKIKRTIMHNLFIIGT